MTDVAVLMVTCCLEQSRTQILDQVIVPLLDQAPQLHHSLTVFDNASTEPGVIDRLKANFANVYQSDRNVGYWSAVHWWLNSLPETTKYTYIIESDMIHYRFNKLYDCAAYLDDSVDVGSVRLHEYSVSEKHLYNKDRPLPESRRNLWQSHTNKVNGKPVIFLENTGEIWETTFLTQLPALNRFAPMKSVFNELADLPNFSEVDFQSRYWKHFVKTGILDGGLFHCNLQHYGGKDVTGSWTSPSVLKSLGYQTTRYSSIVPLADYTVTKI